jgi:hypothetical protein
MLTDEERQRIQLEEQYRLEVCKQLEQEKPKPSRSWTFLNSTFTLWLLSAVVITWAGTLYTQSQNRRIEAQKAQDAAKSEAAKNKELVERLDLEIGYRLSQVQINLVSLVTDWGTKKTRFTFRPGMSEKEVREIIDSLSQPSSKKFPPLYQEFSSFSTLALIAELRRHVPPEQKAELDQVLADLSGVYVYLDVHEIQVSDVHGVGTALYNGFTIGRWRAGMFYFADCPFC